MHQGFLFLATSVVAPFSTAAPLSVAFEFHCSFFRATIFTTFSFSFFLFLLGLFIILLPVLGPCPDFTVTS